MLIAADMEFVKNFTPLDFQEKILHRQFHLILTALVRKTQKMSKNGEIYTAGKNFTLPPALTNSTSESNLYILHVESGQKLLGKSLQRCNHL